MPSVGWTRAYVAVVFSIRRWDEEERLANSSRGVGWGAVDTAGVLEHVVWAGRGDTAAYHCVGWEAGKAQMGHHER